MTNEERQLRADRQAAVRGAWKAEAERVKNGMGSRNWSKEERAELLTRGSVKGYEGHHMVSVANDRSLARDPNNIQFLTHDEHINGAHQGDPHNLTNGYYNPQTKTMEPFENKGLQPQPTYNLATGEPVTPGETQGAKGESVSAAAAESSAPANGPGGGASKGGGAAEGGGSGGGGSEGDGQSSGDSASSGSSASNSASSGNSSSDSSDQSSSQGR